MSTFSSARPLHLECRLYEWRLFEPLFKNMATVFTAILALLKAESESQVYGHDDESVEDRDQVIDFVRFPAQVSRESEKFLLSLPTQRFARAERSHV